MKNKIVLITGASSGIGKACAEIFAENGANLILCSRNINSIEFEELSLKYNVKIVTEKLDVRDEESVKRLLNKVNDSFGKIDILINNAGLALGLEKFQDGKTEDWDTMIDTNIKGLLYMTRYSFELLNNAKSPLIINIGSLAGVAAYPLGAVYCATKAAVKFISDGLRQDTVNTNIRVSNIQPGMVETNFSVVRFHGNKDKAGNVYKGIKPLSPEDIADVIYYTASVPEHVQICEVTVTPRHQATGGVVYKD